MKPQHFRELDHVVVNAFIDARRQWDGVQPKLRLAWSNWGFGTEALPETARRLQRNDIKYIELHGNLYGPDLGYRPQEVLRILDDHGITVGGVCGIVTPEQEVASNKPHVLQRAIDYFKRQADFCKAAGGTYVMFGAGAVGRPIKYDDFELERAADTCRVIADYFEKVGVRGAIEPIRPEEVSVGHTFAEVDRLLALIDRSGCQYFSGDLYHMLSGEEHIGKTILDYGRRMINLQLADSNRRGLGQGLLDIDIVLMALYAVGYNRGENYCSAEPLGAGGNPFVAMFAPPNTRVVDELVAVTAATFYGREQEILAASDEDLKETYQIP
jgi:D-psicose/D-tagatose/L-ribulose 3-epimerase